MSAPQLPVLCRTCGGPCVPTDDGQIVCTYCGTLDRLPAAELDRMLELRHRVTTAANAAVQLEGSERALAHIFERRGAFWRVSGLWFAFVPFVIVYVLVGSWSTIVRAPPHLRAALLLQTATGPALLGGVGLAMCAALWVGRRGYRRRIRPHLRARAPRRPGLPARCRACGADLPDLRDALIACVFCATVSLVTIELARDRTRLLDEELCFHRDRSHRALAATTHSATHMTRTLVAAVVVVYLALFGLAWLASSLVRP